VKCASSIASAHLAAIVFSLSASKSGYLEAPNTKVWPLLVAAGVLVSIFHGRELNAEEYLHDLTWYLRVHCG
jgi:hypothetical protein